MRIEGHSRSATISISLPSMETIVSVFSSLTINGFVDGERLPQTTNPSITKRSINGPFAVLSASARRFVALVVRMMRQRGCVTSTRSN